MRCPLILPVSSVYQSDKLHAYTLMFIMHSLYVFFLGRSKLKLDNVYIIMVYCLKAGLSNLFGTAGSTRINLEAAGRNSKQRRKFSEHNKN